MIASSVDTTDVHADSSRRSLVAACVGNGVEWYDFAIYGALATVITPLFYPEASPSSQLFAAFAIFATAFMARPFGALYFGRRADLRGRRGVMVAVILSMSVATAAIGLLPTYAVIGVAAPLLLVVLRATQGFTAGGELGVALAFLAEHAPSGRRGSVAAWQPATLGLGVAAGFAVTGVLALLFPEDDLDGWWRLAFLIALPMGLIGLHMRRRSAETPGFTVIQHEQLETADSVRTVWRTYRPALRAGFMLIAAASVAFNTFFIFIPNHLIADDDLSLPSTLLPAAVGLVIAAAATVALGRLSDRIGRRRVVGTSTLAIAVLALPMMMLANQGSPVALITAETVIGIAVGGAMSVAMVAEMFSTSVRATGIAMTGGLATALLGGTAPLVGQALTKSTGFDAAPGIYVAVFAIAGLLAIRTWPESAFDDLS